MNRTSIIAALAVSALFLTAAILQSCQESKPAAPSSKDMLAPFTAADQSSFVKPPKVHYPETWFHFIDGNVAREGIRKDLEAIAGADISGVQLFHGGQFGGDWPGVEEHVTCLSEKWDELIAFTASEAKRLGLRFSMQNCPGWAMSGGPWIKPENAMRHLCCSRIDVDGGKILTLSLPADVRDNEKEWRDYRDVAVLAFPTPYDDIPDGLKPSHVSSDLQSDELLAMLCGESKNIKVQACAEGQSHFVDIRFDKMQTVRTIVFSPVQQFSHDWCYEPGVSVVLEAVSDNGVRTKVLDADMPQSSWQDDKEISFALDESRCDHYVLSISNKHDMNLKALRLMSGARKNNWEAEAGWTLRSIPYESEAPSQSATAFVRKEDIIDLSAQMSSDGVLNWMAPEGKWTILRIGHINAGNKNGPAPLEATGWECDKFSKQSADLHFASYIKRIAGGPAKGKLDAMLMDSWECKTQTWTTDMEKEFSGFCGYKLREWLPAVFGYVIDSHETSFCFLSDWRDCINKLFSANFYGRMAENARAEGLAIAYETAAGDVFPGDILEYFKYADVPMCEFWNDPKPDCYVGSYNFKPIKVTASASHVYGKTRVAAESLTSFDLSWDEHFSRLKDLVNQNYSKGVTHSVFHTYTHNPCADTLVPGTSFGSSIGTPFLRGQTWWKYMPDFTLYLARLSYMLERGRPVADVLWYLGDGSMHKPDENYDFPKGYKYDYCNQDVLLNRLTVKDGRLVTPEGLSYSLLWIEDNHHLKPATAAKLLELVRQGAVLVADRPLEMGTLVSDVSVPAANGKAASDYEKYVSALWGNAASAGTADEVSAAGVAGVASAGAVSAGDGSGVASSGALCTQVGRGKLLSGMSIADALTALGIEPDLLIADGTEANWIHRSTEGADWYFISSPLNEPFKGSIDIKGGGSLSLWDPVTGKMSVLQASQSTGRSRVSLDLPYAGSCFVVRTDTELALSGGEGRQAIQAVYPLDQGWTLSFPEGWGAPESMELSSLVPWKDLPLDEEGRAYSGTARYSCDVLVSEFPQDAVCQLDLGKVEEVAVVYLNGKKISTLWCPPYCADISKYLKYGHNDLCIEVTSTWFNRLVFDASLDESLRKTWTIKGPKAGSPLRDSGLLGPVRVIVR